MNLRGISSRVGTVAVAIVAAAGSYAHMRQLSLMAGQPGWLAWMLPASVDGMMIVASVAMTDGRTIRWPSRLAFWVGIAASLAANVLSAHPGWVAAHQETVASVVAAWPALALLLTVEILVRTGGRSESAAGGQTASVVANGQRPTTDTRPVATATPVNGQQVAGQRPAATDTTVATPATDSGQAPAATRPERPRPHPVRADRDRPAATAASGQPDPRVTALLAERPTATSTDVASLLDVSERTARRRLAAARLAVAGQHVANGPAMAAV